MPTRRTTLRHLGTGMTAASLFGLGALTSCKQKGGSAVDTLAKVADSTPFFKISLAQWSLHRSFFGDALKGGFGPFVKMLREDPDALLQGALDPIDFPTIARKDFGVDAIELVNTFYYSKVTDMAYLKDLKDRCDSEGVKAVLIMCDALGDLGDLNAKKRNEAIQNHHPWVDAAKYLGCHAIRVNAAGQGTADEVKAAAIEGLSGLTEYGVQNDCHIIVENHGSYSSNGQWLASVMEGVDNSYCGTLPDFGNFCITRAEDYSCIEEYDRYQGMKELMPFAKGVSAKTHDFDDDGNEIHTDFKKMLQIVKDAGYTGYIDIEYEGQTLSEPEGIIATKALLERVGAELG